MKKQSWFAPLLIAAFIYQTKAYSPVSPVSIPINGKRVVATPLVTVTERPRCDLHERNGTCCLTVSVPSKEEHVETCVRMELDNKNETYASLLFQDYAILNRQVKAGEYCRAIQWTPLTACLNTYYLDVDRKRNTTNACFLVNISNLLYLDFKCMKNINGRFKQHSERTAESEKVYGYSSAYFSN